MSLYLLIYELIKFSIITYAVLLLTTIHITLGIASMVENDWATCPSLPLPLSLFLPLSSSPSLPPSPPLSHSPLLFLALRQKQVSRSVDTRQRSRITPPTDPTTMRGMFMRGMVVAMVAWTVEEPI